MKTDNDSKLRTDRVWLSPERCWIDDFAALTARQTDPSDYPFATEIRARADLRR